MKIMTFHLPDGEYAVELSAVAAVTRPRGAGSRASAFGGIAGGGGAGAEGGAAASPPVFDLADRLGLGRGTGTDAPAVVLRGAGRSAGARVERLGEVVEVEEIRRLPRYFAHALLRGVAEVEEKLVVVLDAEGLVAGVEGEGSEGAEG
jgi:chemotaxis signal transduction protein